jgi:hypothetical protein
MTVPAFTGKGKLAQGFKRHSRLGALAIVFLSTCTLGLSQVPTARVNRAPSINGTVEGSIQQMLPENVTLNGGAHVTGDLLVPGSPSVRLNGQPNYIGTLDATGSATPSNYQITLNGNATLRNVVRRTDPVALPTLGAPASPTGTVDLTINTTGQSINWTTLRSLTLNSNVGAVPVPTGSYRNFTASGGSSFVLGVAGATQASIYNFQALTLNGGSQIQILGPVVLNIANSFTVNGGSVGAAGNPAWLSLNISSGGLSLNGGATFYGFVVAPSGTVVINGNCLLFGGVISNRLTVNGNGTLRLQSAQSLNQAPSVSVISPANGASFTAPGSFTLEVNATDLDGSIAKVEFYQGTTLLGEDISAPYTLTLSGLNAGSYSYYARAIDNQGASADAASVAVSVISPNLPPVVALTSPVDGATFTAPATVSLTASATDADGVVAKVEFYQGSTKIGEDTLAPFTLTAPILSTGTYEFSAKAFDNLGAATISAQTTITVLAPNQLPAVAITSPTDGTKFTAPATFTLEATASDADGGIAKVEFYQDTTRVGEDASAPYALPLTNVAAGAFSYYARAIDNLGASTDSAAVIVTVTDVIPNLPPVVALTSPLDGATTFAPATLTLSATASDPDGTVAKVEFYQGAIKIGEDMAAPFEYTTSALSSAIYDFTAKAIDNLGATTTSGQIRVSVLTPNQLPAVSITAPLDGAMFTAPASFNIEATASDSDGSIAKVEFYSGTTKLGESSGPIFSFPWTTVPPGVYTITARAIDNSGGMTASAAVVLTVNGPPSIVLASPANNSTFFTPASIGLVANASDTDGSIVKVEFFEGATKLGESTGPSYNFSWNGAVARDYTLTARATDNLGAITTSAPVNVAVRPPPLTALLEVMSPANGEVITYSRPMLGARYAGTTPVRPDSFSVYLDGANFSSEVMIESGELMFSPIFDLKDGQHTYRVDWKYQGQIVASDNVTFSVAATIEGTQFSGEVRSTTGEPLSNVRVRAADQEVFTGSNGKYQFTNLPVGELVFHFETATVLGGGKYAPVSLAFEVVENKATRWERPVYLPPVDESQGMMVYSNHPTAQEITNPTLPGIKVVIQANTEIAFPDGAADGVVTIVDIPIDRSPNCMGADFRPSRLISVQPENTILSKPAELVMPNDLGLVNGTQARLYNLNILTGRFGPTGLAYVDGEFVRTVAGSGITTFDWYGAPPPGPGGPGSDGGDGGGGGAPNGDEQILVPISLQKSARCRKIIACQAICHSTSLERLNCTIIQIRLHPH